MTILDEQPDRADIILPDYDRKQSSVCTIEMWDADGSSSRLQYVAPVENEPFGSARLVTTVPAVHITIDSMLKRAHQPLMRDRTPTIIQPMKASYSSPYYLATPSLWKETMAQMAPRHAEVLFSVLVRRVTRTSAPYRCQIAWVDDDQLQAWSNKWAEEFDSPLEPINTVDFRYRMDENFDITAIIESGVASPFIYPKD